MSSARVTEMSQGTLEGAQIGGVTEPPAAADPELGREDPAVGSVRKAVSAYLPPLALFIALLAVWQYLVGALDVEEFVLPTPTEIASEMWESRSLLLENGWVTLREVAGGFLAALVVGVVLAVLMAESALLRRTLYPLVVTSQTVPTVAIAPLIIVWFGFGMASKVYVAALIAFFPIVVNTTTGLGALENDLQRLMRSFPASRWQIFTKARVPAALPYFFAGIKIAMVLSVIGAVIGEFVGADAGLGSYIVQQNAALETAAVFAAIVTLSIMGVALFALVTLIERLVIPWYFVDREGGQ
jgi:NitT/TauT family transport system permease protein